MTSDSENSAGQGDLFNEPDGYYQPEKPATFVEHTLQSGQQLHLRLVGHNPLWVRSHYLLHLDQHTDGK